MDIVSLGLSIVRGANGLPCKGEKNNADILYRSHCWGDDRRNDHVPDLCEPGGKKMKMYTNDFKGKKELVKDLAEVYKNISYSDILNIELKKYVNEDGGYKEFVLLTWSNGAISTANNNANSLTATVRNVARMLDGGVYENLDFYKVVMKSEHWREEL